MTPHEAADVGVRERIALLESERDAALLRLSEETASWQSVHRAEYEKREALDAEVARLRDALKPFAAFADVVITGTRDHTDDTPFYGFDFVQITYGDLRRARATLTPRGEGD